MQHQAQRHDPTTQINSTLNGPKGLLLEKKSHHRQGSNTKKVQMTYGEYFGLPARPAHTVCKQAILLQEPVDSRPRRLMLRMVLAVANVVMH